MSKWNSSWTGGSDILIINWTQNVEQQFIKQTGFGQSSATMKKNVFHYYNVSNSNFKRRWSFIGRQNLSARLQGQTLAIYGYFFDNRTTSTPHETTSMGLFNFERESGVEFCWYTQEKKRKNKTNNIVRLRLWQVSRRRVLVFYFLSLPMVFTTLQRHSPRV